MTYLKKIATACAVAASLIAGSAAAAPILLDFEGVGDLAAVNDFYNGGASGANYGITFSSAALGLVDTDAGGNGGISNMPSGVTVLAFFETESVVMNVAAGFDSRLAFHYSAGERGLVDVYEGYNGTGNLLASIALSVNTSTCEDALNLFCRFNQAELLFASTARSVVFRSPGFPGWVAFDDVTLGALAVEPPADVPEPASLALSALGLAGLAAARRKSRTAK